MEMDGAMVHLKQGDVLVQRGTIHNWINRGSEPCVVAFVLVAAKPVERAGKLFDGDELANNTEDAHGPHHCSGAAWSCTARR